MTDIYVSEVLLSIRDQKRGKENNKNLRNIIPFSYITVRIDYIFRSQQKIVNTIVERIEYNIKVIDFNATID